jgi:hypothetical protein
VRDPASPLQSLLSRDTLLPTLARVLREDGMKSLELATAVAGCFLACSSLAQLHKLLLENQVRGSEALGTFDRRHHG